jgi:class 3 adenylate cyclase/tetratricopeptide (TPR) repeat protein
LVTELAASFVTNAAMILQLPKRSAILGERKHVTVLFSDLTGYTSMSEKLDPEEVKEVTTQIFDEISKIVGTYDGFIEKFAGDAVMAMFGATTSHEDDPVRAIRAAMEIHNVVNQLSPRYEEIIEQPLSMHTGINTGLVVTGDINLEKGTHGVAGDTLNVAARLSSIGNADDIMVGPDTFCQAEGFFNFKSLKPTKVKGKAKPVQIYKVLSLKEHPRKVHRLQGVRSELIGRTAEMRQLKNAVERLKQGQGTVISICGAAGTGKSRLIEEFKASMDLKEIQWREGHAYPYTQDISYAPFIDIMNRAFRVKDGDSPDTIKEKVEKGIEYLIDNKEDIVPYVGSLYELKYPEIEGLSPEFWKSGLQKAIQDIVLGLTRKGPTIFCFEDLHWADPSSIDLLHYLLSNFRYPAILLCVYRPVFSLFTSHQVNSIGKIYEEIQLLGLSPTEVHNMVESLLKTKSIPFELKGFVQKKVEGNPFFLEEVINSLIESETLMRDNGTWKLIKPITESEVPATIHGVLSARFDRLESEKKRVLQEASVIGRAFFYDILKKITDIRDQCDQCINALERLDLVRAKSFQPDLEYIFKHALTQEVVYNGLLKKERQMLHEKIGLVMEQLFQDRLSEFYETLAFHFKKGQSLIKAVDYLMKSGEKSLGRYSLEESHQNYKEAFDILTKKPDKSREEEMLLIDLLIKWAYVYYYRGYFDDLIDLFRAHENLAESLNDKAKQGMFNAWLGFALFTNGKGKIAYQYLHKALEQGEETGNQQLICYAYCWLAWVFWDLGFLDKGIIYAERAHDIAKSIEPDHYLYFKPLGAGRNRTDIFMDWR